MCVIRWVYPFNPQLSVLTYSMKTVENMSSDVKTCGHVRTLSLKMSSEAISMLSRQGWSESFWDKPTVDPVWCHNGEINTYLRFVSRSHRPAFREERWDEITPKTSLAGSQMLPFRCKIKPLLISFICLGYFQQTTPLYYSSSGSLVLWIWI